MYTPRAPMLLLTKTYLLKFRTCLPRSATVWQVGSLEYIPAYEPHSMFRMRLYLSPQDPKRHCEVGVRKAPKTLRLVHLPITVKNVSMRLRQCSILASEKKTSRAGDRHWTRQLRPTNGTTKTLVRSARASLKSMQRF